MPIQSLREKDGAYGHPGLKHESRGKKKKHVKKESGKAQLAESESMERS